MLVSAMTFEVRNFATGAAEQFVVHNTDDNYTMVAMRRDTRDIKFIEFLDFDFDRKYKAPKFITFAQIALAAFDNTIADEIDEIDEMVGCF